MEMLDLDKLSIEELNALEKDISKAIKSFDKRKRKTAMTRLEAVAKEEGFTLAELLDGVKAPKRASAPAKYRHPEDANLSWSGRGRQPIWYKEAIAAGMTEADLLVS